MNSLAARDEPGDQVMAVEVFIPATDGAVFGRVWEGAVSLVLNLGHQAPFDG